MGGAQLRVREIRNFGSVAKYSGVDLGRDQGSGRGDVSASFFRVTEDKRYECFTFLPDTIHNRLQLLQRQVELAEWVGDSWALVGKDSIEGYLAPAVAMQSAQVAPVGVELGSAALTEDPALAEPVVVGGIEDFLGLSKETQLEVLARDDFSAEALTEILECRDSRLTSRVRNAAIRKAEKLVPSEA